MICICSFYWIWENKRLFFSLDSHLVPSYPFSLFLFFVTPIYYISTSLSSIYYLFNLVSSQIAHFLLLFANIIIVIDDSKTGTETYTGQWPVRYSTIPYRTGLYETKKNPSLSHGYIVWSEPDQTMPEPD